MTFELDLVRCGEYVQSSRLASGGKLGPGSGFPLAAAGTLTGLDSNKLAK